jgi:hypothetical protein
MGSGAYRKGITVNKLLIKMTTHDKHQTIMVQQCLTQTYQSRCPVRNVSGSGGNAFVPAALPAAASVPAGADLAAAALLSAGVIQRCGLNCRASGP